MPAQMRSPNAHNGDADALLHPLSDHNRKIPRSVGADDGTEEEKGEVVVKVEEPVFQPSPFLAEVAEAEEEQHREHVAAIDKEDSDSSLEAEEELSEYVDIDLREIRKEVQCPICLGIIKKTRTVMECLHRFCRECIDKSMRMGNNECPACRTHCASRRSLRDDPKYDALIAALFPSIEIYEEEELALCEEDKSRNKQIQASIAQTFKRQSEALGKKRSPKKGTRAQSSSRSQKKSRETPSRRRKRSEETELEAYADDGELEYNEERTSSYSREHVKDTDQHKHKTRRRIGPSGHRSSATSSDGGCTGNELEQMRSYPGIMWDIKMRAWGKSGSRSNGRHGGVANRKKPQPPHLAKLIEFIHSLEKKDDEENAALNSSSHLLAAASEAPEGSHNKQDRMSDTSDQSQTGPQAPEEKKTRAFAAYCISHRGQLILACQQKEAM